MNQLAIMPTFLRTRKDLDVTTMAISSFRSTATKFDLLVVDDGSPDLELVNSLQDVCIANHVEYHLKSSNDGFSKTVNIGLNKARKQMRDAILVNADVEFSDPGWDEHFYYDDGVPHADVQGGLLFFPNMLVQHAGVFFSVLRRDFDHMYRYAPSDLPSIYKQRRCPVTGALMFISYKALRIVGVFDERFKMGWEDLDYCIRTFEAGMECLYNPAVWALHHESMFRKRSGDEKTYERTARSWEYLWTKHAGTDFASYVPTHLEAP